VKLSFEALQHLKIQASIQVHIHLRAVVERDGPAQNQARTLSDESHVLDTEIPAQDGELNPAGVVQLVFLDFEVSSIHFAAHFERGQAVKFPLNFDFPF
jgi:hypothetical protein